MTDLSFELKQTRKCRGAQQKEKYKRVTGHAAKLQVWFPLYAYHMPYLGIFFRNRLFSVILYMIITPKFRHFYTSNHILCINSTYIIWPTQIFVTNLQRRTDVLITTHIRYCLENWIFQSLNILLDMQRYIYRVFIKAATFKRTLTCINLVYTRTQGKDTKVLICCVQSFSHTVRDAIQYSLVELLVSHLFHSCLNRYEAYITVS